MILRSIGRLIGAWAGAAVSHAGPSMGRWMGLALMPQAGVALGMALVAVHHRPDLHEVIMPVVIASTVLFEVVGPVLTRGALVHAGKARRS